MRFIWIGRTRNEHLRALIEDYRARLARFVGCEVVELRESGSGERHAVVEDEGKRIEEALRRRNAFVVLLSIDGKQFSSVELAAEIERWEMRAMKEVAFVVGGRFGVSSGIERRAGLRWSLSRLTLTHEMARLVMIEQLYRAHTIIRGLPYQK